METTLRKMGLLSGVRADANPSPSPPGPAKRSITGNDFVHSGFSVFCSNLRFTALLRLCSVDSIEVPRRSDRRCVSPSPWYRLAWKAAIHCLSFRRWSRTSVLTFSVPSGLRRFRNLNDVELSIKCASSGEVPQKPSTPHSRGAPA